MKKSVRKLGKVGKYSYAITIPGEFIKKLKWKERQKLVVSLKGKRLVVEDWEKK